VSPDPKQQFQRLGVKGRIDGETTELVSVSKKNPQTVHFGA